MSIDGTVVNATPGKANPSGLFRTLSIVGAVVGYGALIAFLILITMQTYRWFRDGDWTHFGVSEALHIMLGYCGVTPADPGHWGGLARWLDTPLDWLGLHKVFEVVPASLALFLLSMLGNSVFIYCRDRTAPEID